MQKCLISTIGAPSCARKVDSRLCARRRLRYPSHVQSDSTEKCLTSRRLPPSFHLDSRASRVQYSLTPPFPSHPVHHPLRNLVCRARIESRTPIRDTYLQDRDTPPHKTVRREFVCAIVHYIYICSLLLYITYIKKNIYIKYTIAQANVRTYYTYVYMVYLVQ